jgi:hypothetical protein
LHCGGARQLKISKNKWCDKKILFQAALGDDISSRAWGQSKFRLRFLLPLSDHTTPCRLLSLSLSSLSLSLSFAPLSSLYYNNGRFLLAIVEVRGAVNFLTVTGCKRQLLDCVINAFWLLLLLLLAAS